MGGTLATRVSVGPGDSGIVIAGTGEARDLQLQALTETEGAPARARGSLAARFAWNSRGLDAAGLIDNLAGEGSIDVSAGTLDRLNPLMVDAASQSALANASQLSVDGIRAEVESQRPLGSLAFPALSIPAKIDAGALRLQTIVVDGKSLDLTVDTALGLANLTLTSRWRVASKSKFAGGEPLPPVVITYAGPVRDLTRLEPVVDVTDLEAELAKRAVLLEFMRGSTGGSEDQPVGDPDASGSIIDPSDGANPASSSKVPRWSTAALRRSRPSTPPMATRPAMIPQPPTSAP